jgi:alpha-L-fucosidase 2
MKYSAQWQAHLDQVFEAIISASSIVGESDTTFLNSVTAVLASLDKGFHIGTWGEVKEWKIPDSLGYDFKNDTHRHLSNLVGWYPGYSISSFLGGYQNITIQNAVATSLWSRGLGNGPDANAGWEKVWRSACWARLNNTDRAYLEFKLAIKSNFANNGLSMYTALKPPFQIDANFGLAGAVLSMLVVDIPMLTGVNSVILGPAIPTVWGRGQVRGLRLRGGGYVSFTWDSKGLVSSAQLVGRTKPVVIMNKDGKVLAKQ